MLDVNTGAEIKLTSPSWARMATQRPLRNRGVVLHPIELSSKNVCRARVESGMSPFFFVHIPSSREQVHDGTDDLDLLAN